MMRLNNRGDTIVEVLLATVILSMVLAGAYSISNRATRINQQAYERTRVSNFLQEQAEVLRSLRDTTDPLWVNLLSGTSGNLQASLTDVASTCSDPTFDFDTNREDADNFFIDAVDTDSDGIEDTYEYYSNGSETVPDLEGLFQIWIEAYEPSGASYIDFHIHGCWQPIGSGPNQQSGIVIRLEKNAAYE